MLSLERLQHDFQTIAGFTETPGHGATRPTFSDAWAQAVDYVLAQAQAAGCAIRRDPAGNAFARSVNLDPEEPVWLVGSHLDSVPHGGDYDGVAGVLTALELLRSAYDDGFALPVELAVFAEEEGPTFGLGMLGSRAMAGTLTADQLQALTNAQGQSFFEAGQAYGAEPTRLPDARLQPHGYLGLIELHAEQGPGMWRHDQRLAVVRSIAGRRQYTVTLTGEANHAGATAMHDRRDALAAAAECLSQLEALAPKLGPDAVLTVGRLIVEPNAINVIPDRVTFTIDLRAPEDAQLAEGDVQLCQLVTQTATRRRLDTRIEQTESLPAQPLDATLVDRLTRLTDTPAVVSGALHDAAILAPLLPTAMLFIPSRDGISHNPAEFSRVEDVHAAVAALERLVRQPTLHRLNHLGREAFVITLGGIYEHSPWIADAVYDQRPFATIDDLHDAMQHVVAQATEPEQLALIRAHPDLVGKLAKQGQLTPESTAEQRAAGLETLTPDEAQQFDRHNAAYHAKFGFPFVICARQNRKAAILAAFPKRLAHERDAEVATALTEIGKIARLRLRDAISETHTPTTDDP
ncbi:MAG: 2-oxo-4-hydroxy-4-carboxy-5-ureidoimidazoline decarboxylase [Planctomycetota bacterium]